MKRMEITGYLIVQLEDQLLPEEAFSELLDNALDAGATTIEIVYTSRSMSITDNGNGCADPNLFFTPSQGASRFKNNAIGSKAAGGKQACATFGRKWDVQTVVRGKNQYHRYTVSWDQDGALPPAYSGRASNAYSAPKEIRGGGTKIMVTARRPGAPTIRLDSICRKLESIYRPQLNSSGVTISIRNPEVGSGRQLQNKACDASLFVGAIAQLRSTAASRAFTVRYGLLKEQHRILSGCHLIFGPRVIKTLDSIGRFALPPAIYIDVVLSDEWKMLLSTNKTRIAHYSSELIDAIEILLGDWIEAQRKQAMTYKMQIIAGEISTELTQAMAYLHQTPAPGTHQPAPPEPRATTRDDQNDEHSHPIVIRHKGKKRDRRAKRGGTLAAWQETKPQVTLLKINFDETLNRDLFHVTYAADRTIEVRLNTGPHQREIAAWAKKTNSKESMFPIGAFAFAEYVALNSGQFADMFSHMRGRGYDIDENDNHLDIVAMVANCLIDLRAEGRQAREDEAA